MTGSQASIGTIERKADGGTDPAARVKYWRAELDAASSTEKDWRQVAKDIVELYRNEKKRAGVDSTRFNILYSSTETLSPALYNQSPNPDVRRRFKNADPVGKVAADVVERALSFDIENDDLDSLIEDVVQDALLVGRGVPWVDYDAVIAEAKEAGADGQPATVEHLADERVPGSLIDWMDFRMSPAKRWKQVRWVARSLRPTRDECIDKFGKEIGEKIPLTYSTRGEKAKDDPDAPADPYKRAVIWQIWSKEERKVIHIADGFDEAPAKEEDDPLNLRDFFPCPQPLYRVKTTGSMVPIPEYTLYEDQAKELETVSRRIIALTEVLKARGWRAADAPDIDAIEDLSDGQLAPVVNWAQYAQNPGGLAAMIAWMPIQQIAAVIVQLYDAREKIKAVIYEITGQADIMRGAGDPRETATAQKIKGRYGGLRLQRGQRSVQRLIRDLIRIKAEIIAEKFELPTLQAMTGIELPDQVTRDAARQALAASPPAVSGLPLQEGGMPPAPPMPIPPNAAEIAAKPTWDEVMAVLRSDPLRRFRIDIETDSTIQPDAEAEQKNRVEFLTAVTSLISALAPLVGAGAIPKDTARDLILFGARGFKVGSQLEDSLDRIGRDDQGGGAPAGPPGQPAAPDPGAAEAAKVQAEAATKQAEIEGKLAVEKAQAEADIAVQNNKAQLDAELQRMKVQADIKRDRMKAEAEIAVMREKAAAEIQLKREIEMLRLQVAAQPAPAAQPAATMP